MDEENAALQEAFEDITAFPACSIVRNLDFPDRCEYVKITPECKEARSHINYIHFFYCTLNPQSSFTQVLAMCVYIIFCLFMFVILNITADKFFCPALKMISREFHMNEHLAGVTLVAFGNGSPDLFSTFSSAKDLTRHIFSDMLGGANYVTNIVGGLICIIAPFKLHPNNLIRDVYFLILAVVYIEYALVTDGKVTLLESVCILTIYIVYIIVIIADQYILKTTIRKLEKYLEKRAFLPEHIKKIKQDQIVKLRAEAYMELISKTSGTSVNIEWNRRSSYVAKAPANSNIYQQFFLSLNPINTRAWHRGNLGHKIVIVLTAPIKVVMQIFIPTCDYELDRHGWSKLLNCLQLVYLPGVSTLIIFGFKGPFGIPIFIIVLLIAMPFSILIFYSTRTDLPPKFHVIFALLATYGSMFTIYTCASEVVDILRVLGLIMNRTNSFLGCTVLSWGNSIGDLVSNITFSLQGYQKMGFAACYGAPFLNIVLAIGGVYFYRCLTSETYSSPSKTGFLGENSYIFLVIMLFCVLLWSSSTNYNARRIIGIFHLITYGLFIMYALLGELEVIQTFAPIS